MKTATIRVTSTVMINTNGIKMIVMMRRNRAVKNTIVMQAAVIRIVIAGGRSIAMMIKTRVTGIGAGMSGRRIDAGRGQSLRVRI